MFKTLEQGDQSPERSYPHNFVGASQQAVEQEIIAPHSAKALACMLCGYHPMPAIGYREEPGQCIILAAEGAEGMAERMSSENIASLKVLALQLVESLSHSIITEENPFHEVVRTASEATPQEQRLAEVAYQLWRVVGTLWPEETEIIDVLYRASQLEKSLWKGFKMSEVLRAHLQEVLVPDKA
jgi:hypothetical protein